MEDKELYRKILRYALIILISASIISFLVMQDMIYVYSVLFGGFLSILGFISIVYMVTFISLEGNVKQKFMGAYILRYLIYFACMFMGAKVGLNIVSMLIGFLCINLSIKIEAVLERKEESELGK